MGSRKKSAEIDLNGHGGKNGVNDSQNRVVQKAKTVSSLTTRQVLRLIEAYFSIPPAATIRNPNPEAEDLGDTVEALGVTEGVTKEKLVAVLASRNLESDPALVGRWSVIQSITAGLGLAVRDLKLDALHEAEILKLQETAPETGATADYVDLPKMEKEIPRS